MKETQAQFVRRQILDYTDWTKEVAATSRANSAESLDIPSVTDHVFWWIVSQGRASNYPGTPVVTINRETGNITINGKRMTDEELQSFSDYVIAQVEEYYTPELMEWNYEERKGSRPAETPIGKECRQYVRDLVERELTNGYSTSELVQEFFNCRVAEVLAGGDILIADPQSEHLLSDEELAKFVEWHKGR